VITINKTKTGVICMRDTQHTRTHAHTPRAHVFGKVELDGVEAAFELCNNELNDAKAAKSPERCSSVCSGV